MSCALPPHFHLVVVPDSQPKTKPKACNYGLQLATGQYCVIFDAEDRPDPDQLKKALIAFEHGARATSSACRRKLNHFNQDQNMLTAWFANEYSMHFELILPAMGAAGVADPAGRHLEPLQDPHRCASSAPGTPSTSPRTPTSASGCTARATAPR